MAGAFHLFLAPHLDDAALSCGGMIHDLVNRGATVVVYTIMAGRAPARPPDSPFLRELHHRWGIFTDPVSERRQEDFRALRHLGALARHGTIPDCIYRTTYAPGGKAVALYPDEASLWGPVHPLDTATLLLEATPLLYDRTEVLHVPLGVGGHVDHRLVRDWGRRLARVYREMTVLYYEEYPYNRDPAAVTAALDAFNPPLAGPVLTPLSEAALAAKIAAIGCYESQISSFWPDAAAMVQGVREDTRRAGGEREWQPAG